MSRLRHRPLFLVFVITAIVLFLASLLYPRGPKAVRPAPAFEATANWERSFTIEETLRLEITNFAGNVIVNTDRPVNVSIAATKKARGVSQAEADLSLGDVAIDATQEGNTISLVSRLRGRSDSPSAAFASVDLKITAPPQTAVSIKIGNGSVTVVGPQRGLAIEGNNTNVDVFNVRGPLTVRTKKASLKAVDVSGGCLLETAEGRIYGERLDCPDLVAAAGGNVTLKDARIDGAATIRSGEGGFKIERLRSRTLKAQASAGRSEMIDSTVEDTADVRTERGKVVAERFKAGLLRVDAGLATIDLNEVEGGLQLVNKEGQIEVRRAVLSSLDIQSGKGNIVFSGLLPNSGKASLRSVTGDITIYVDKESSLELDALAKHGKLTAEMPTGVKGDATANTWRGLLKQGGILLTLVTDSGNINIYTGEPL